MVFKSEVKVRNAFKPVSSWSEQTWYIATVGGAFKVHFLATISSLLLIRRMNLLIQLLFFYLWSHPVRDTYCMSALLHMKS